ncbi:hypothetical protein [Thalassotalea euphylliae]|uniref:DNA repair protein n=1 Tax=Thalassotalea euphylliae TaxID=1655234 RepID=A0A3E0UGW3_9GAMM|nr:hypothetical protein [Thalassotalea euphylliae]REL36110.1 hypothetical protein DXX92_12700 [Thalassotalea euphylliae]
MIAIIVGLIIALIIIVVVVSAIQQHKEKMEAEKRAQVAKHKAIIDETEELIMAMALLPENPTVVEVLSRRSLNAAKAIEQIMPEMKGVKGRIQEFENRLKASADMAASNSGKEQQFTLPDNEQQLVQILQCIKKLRATLKSEQNKGALDAQVFMQQDLRLDSMQIKINIESLLKRGNAAYSKEMLGSARQYYEKALSSIDNTANQNEYTQSKKAEIQEKLQDITNELKNTNARDAEKKAKSEEDDLDLLFQPKKKW